MKARDTVAVPALRSALAAIDNAEAVTPATPVGKGLAIEQAPVGVGATEVSRRTLTEEDVERIVGAEVAEREAAAGQYDRTDQPQRAELLRSQARLLSAYLPAAPES